MPSWLQRFEHNQLFTEREAWLLFRLAAFAETIGWTSLLCGLALKRFVLHGNNDPVLITGQIHGTIYLAYFVAPLLLYPSLYWSRWRAVIAVIAGIPPYGSLLFELWTSHERRRRARETWLLSLRYVYLN